MKKNLSEKSFWNSFYEKRRIKQYIPNPKKIRNHFELDRIFRTILKSDNSKKLLELGAGGSIWLPYFSKNFGFQVYGIDYSPNGCFMAKENLRLAKEEGQIICQDIFNVWEKYIDFFDVIVSFGVIEHFEDPSEILYIIKRMLKEDGIVITVVPNTSGILMKIQRFIDEEVYKIHKLMDLEELANFHKKVGLKIINQKYLQFMDLSVINYQNLISNEKLFKFFARSITAINLPILYLQKLFSFFPQSRKFCASMMIIAQNNFLRE